MGYSTRRSPGRRCRALQMVLWLHQGIPPVPTLASILSRLSRQQSEPYGVSGGSRGNHFGRSGGAPAVSESPRAHTSALAARSRSKQVNIPTLPELSAPIVPAVSGPPDSTEACGQPDRPSVTLPRSPLPGPRHRLPDHLEPPCHLTLVQALVQKAVWPQTVSVRRTFARRLLKPAPLQGLEVASYSCAIPHIRLDAFWRNKYRYIKAGLNNFNTL